ncbi:MAG: hypothetical protein OXH57_03410, partial [Ekhidna sp.]|nr:hypothetical protein [Ekhidna sp.]
STLTSPDASSLLLLAGWFQSSSISKRSFKMYTALVTREKHRKPTDKSNRAAIFRILPAKKTGKKINTFFSQCDSLMSETKDSNFIIDPTIK